MNCRMYENTLIEHRNKSVRDIIELLKTEDRVSCVRPTGYGKSYIINELVKNLNGNCIIIEPQNSIVKYVNNYIRIENIKFCTYSSLLSLGNSESVKSVFGDNIKYVYLDEMHRACASEWSKKVELLISTYNCKVIGLTATPIRMDGENSVDVLFNGVQVEPLYLAECILDNLYPMPKIITALYTIEDEVRCRVSSIENLKRLSKKEKAEIINTLQTKSMELSKLNNIPNILSKHLETYYKSGKHMKFIIFCSSIEAIKEDSITVHGWFKSAFKDNNINIHCMHSGMTNTQIENEMNKFETSSENDSINVMLSVNMLNEGVHVKNITGVIMLRNTESRIVYLQQLGRTLTANANCQPIIFDFVNNHNRLKNGLVDSIITEYGNRENSNDNVSSELPYDISINIIDYVKDIIDILNEFDMSFDNWEKWEDDILLGNYEKHGYKYCQEHGLCNRSKGAIVCRAVKSLHLSCTKEWSEAELETIRTCRLHGKNSNETLKYLPNRTKRALLSKANEIGCSFKIEKNFTNFEDNIIIENYFTGGSVLCRENGVNRTYKEINYRARILGLKVQKGGNPWEDWEDAILLRYKIGAITSYKELLPNRTQSAINSRLNTLGLTKKVSKWSPEEIEELTRIYPIGGMKACLKSNIINRSKGSIQAQVLKLRLHVNPSLRESNNL